VTIAADALRRRAGEVSWWHTIDLGQGVVTAGAIGLPARLDGRTVLDVGAWDGAISPETVGGRFDVVLFVGVLYHMARLGRALCEGEARRPAVVAQQGRIEVHGFR
jgi:2-polyprenyl-3-methyl-5-hydroxy-6-metoxy-1,4-benzoquinol methylase